MRHPVDAVSLPTASAKRAEADAYRRRKNDKNVFWSPALMTAVATDAASGETLPPLERYPRSASVRISP